jgi:hypothetical protein
LIIFLHLWLHALDPRNSNFSPANLQHCKVEKKRETRRKTETKPPPHLPRKRAMTTTTQIALARALSLRSRPACAVKHLRFLILLPPTNLSH